MNRTNAVSVAIVVGQAVITYLLVQTDLDFSPVVKVVLGAAGIALTTLARFSNPNGEPVQVELTGRPVAVTPAPAEELIGVDEP